MICLFISILPRFWFPATVGHRSAIALVSRFPGTTTTKLLVPTHTPSRKNTSQETKELSKLDTFQRK
jgi:hypothetical protein